MSYIEIFLIVLGLVVASFFVEYYLQRRRHQDRAIRLRALDRRQHKLADRIGPPRQPRLSRRLPRTGGQNALREANELRDRSAA